MDYDQAANTGVKILLELPMSHIRMPRFEFWLCFQVLRTDNIHYEKEEGMASESPPQVCDERTEFSSRFWPGPVRTIVGLEE